jgi:hypothetical protein
MTFLSPKEAPMPFFTMNIFMCTNFPRSEDGALKTVGAIKSGFSDFAFSAVALHIKNKSFLSFFSPSILLRTRELKDQRPSSGKAFPNVSFNKDFFRALIENKFFFLNCNMILKLVLCALWTLSNRPESTIGFHRKS